MTANSSTPSLRSRCTSTTPSWFATAAITANSRTCALSRCIRPATMAKQAADRPLQSFEDQPLQGQGEQGQAGAEPGEGRRAPGKDRAGARRCRIHFRISGTAKPAESDAVDGRYRHRLSAGGRLGDRHTLNGDCARYQPFGNGRAAHRHPRCQRPGQIDAGQDHRPRSRADQRRSHRRQGAEHRLLRATGTRRATSAGHAARTHGSSGQGGHGLWPEQCTGPRAGTA